MKNIWKCRVTQAAISLPITGWFIQWYNVGTLPLFVQTWGPLVIAIGVVLFRRATTKPCSFCGKK